MSALGRRLLDAGPLDRAVGRVRGAMPGPMLVAVAGIHGNEPAGVLAAREVLGRIESLRLPLRGDLVVLAGNVGALERGVRGIARDLNRGWTRDKIAALPVAGDPAATPEDIEQRQLFDAIEAARREARGPITFLDLHSTSAPGIPFAMAHDQPAQRQFALQFPLPIILGLLELVDATLLEFMCREGCLTLGIEAGQNDAESSLDHHAAVLWLALATVGLVAAGDLPDLVRHRRLLGGIRGALPRVTRIEHRHGITPADRFEMLPGFANIECVRAGQLLAHDRHGGIYAERDGVLLLPLYQAQGDDGFFLGGEVPAEQTAAHRAVLA
jgi:succinylglutamate desuccinylase